MDDGPSAEDSARTWREVQTLHGRVDAVVERALQEACGLSSREFTLLEALHDQHDGPGGHLHMKEVSAAVALSQSATTRLVTRMEERGLLRRGLCPDDRRGVYSNVTDEGQAVLVRARAVFTEVVHQALGAALRDPATAAAAHDVLHRAARGTVGTT